MPVVAPGGQVTCTPYVVSSSETDINAGDLVMFSTKDTIKSVAAITGAIGSPTSSQAYAGVAAQTLLAGVGSTAATLNGSSTASMICR